MSPVERYRAEKATHAQRMAPLMAEARRLLGDDEAAPLSAQGQSNKRRSGRVGLPNQTIEERRAKAKAYYHQNRERILERQRIHKAENQHKIRKYRAAYHARHRDEILARRAARKAAA